MMRLRKCPLVPLPTNRPSDPCASAPRLRSLTTSAGWSADPTYSRAFTPDTSIRKRIHSSGTRSTYDSYHPGASTQASKIVAWIREILSRTVAADLILRAAVGRPDIDAFTTKSAAVDIGSKRDPDEAG